MARFGATGARVLEEPETCSDPDCSDFTAASVSTKIKILVLGLEPDLPPNATSLGLFH